MWHQAACLSIIEINAESTKDLKQMKGKPIFHKSKIVKSCNAGSMDFISFGFFLKHSSEEPLLWMQYGKGYSKNGSKLSMKWQRKLWILGFFDAGKELNENAFKLSMTRTFSIVNLPAKHSGYDTGLKCKKPLYRPTSELLCPVMWIISNPLSVIAIWRALQMSLFEIR